MKLKSLKKTGYQTETVYCGLVDWKGKILYGCHSNPKGKWFNQYSYEVDKGLMSTVTLCPKCEPKREYYEN